MRIRWDRIVALIFAIVLIVLVVKNWAAITLFLSTQHHAEPYCGPHDPTTGFLAFCLIVILSIALARIITRSNK